MSFDDRKVIPSLDRPGDSKFTVSTHIYEHTELESIEATFSLSKVHDVTKEKTTLSLIIEKSKHMTVNGEEVDRTRYEASRMRIKPSHGWGGFTHDECMWIADMIPKLWDEWERKVGP